MKRDRAEKTVLEYMDAHIEQARERLFSLLRIPSISTQPHHGADCRQAATWLRDDLRSLGMKADLREVTWAKPGHPMVVAHSAAPNEGGPHVLFYGHYDVQPTDPDHLWETPPFEPHVIKDETGRSVIVARGASDDKGQVMTFIEACRAWKAVHGVLPLKVSLLLEGEEESGGENLLPFLKENAQELKADVALICDTAMPDKDTPAVTTSLRGTVAEEIEITAATRDLHSGMYGNAAANPIAILCQVLSALRDQDGRVTLPHFYDGVTIPDEQTRQQWRQLYPDDQALLDGTGLSIAAGEKDFSAVEQTWCRPSCEINGISGGYEGEGFKTVLPAKAKAKVSFRLVPGQDPHRIRESFRAYVRQHIPADVRVDFISYGGSTGFAISQGSAFLPAVLKALTDEWQKEAVKIGSGGSIPVAQEVREALGMEALMVGFAQADDRIHSPNERYGVESFYHGIRSWIRILAECAALKS